MCVSHWEEAKGGIILLMKLIAEVCLIFSSSSTVHVESNMQRKNVLELQLGQESLYKASYISGLVRMSIFSEKGGQGWSISCSGSLTMKRTLISRAYEVKKDPHWETRYRAPQRILYK